MPSRMACTEITVERSRSVSSTHRTNCQPVARADSHTNSAVLAPPICKSPVGEGAKRVLTGGLTVDMAVLQTGGQARNFNRPHPYIPRPISAIKGGLTGNPCACMSPHCTTDIAAAGPSHDDRLI